MTRVYNRPIVPRGQLIVHAGSRRPRRGGAARQDRRGLTAMDVVADQQTTIDELRARLSRLEALQTSAAGSGDAGR